MGASSCRAALWGGESELAPLKGPSAFATSRISGKAAKGTAKFRLKINHNINMLPNVT